MKYEINATIEGFGYRKDPRVAELRGARNPEEDMLVVFECTESQIAHSVDQINESTKAYVGKLEPGIFDRLPEGVENVYAKFQEGRVPADERICLRRHETNFRLARPPVRLPRGAR